MRIESGLFDHMVLQRLKNNLSDAVFSGTALKNGIIKATARNRDNRILRGFDNSKVGIASNGRIRGCLKGLPTGGPYKITLKLSGEKLLINDVLVGDVWLLGGQSNMQGYGLFPKKRLPSNPMVRAFYMDDRWDIAKDPVHNMWECVDPVHVDICGGEISKPDPDFGVSPGPTFALETYRITGVPQGIIACAHGGTSMTQWDPARKNEGGKSLYGALIRRFLKNGGRVAGMIWYQGCSDAKDMDAKFYTDRMKKLLSCLRRDCKNNSLPVVIVQIGRFISSAASHVYWNYIQEQQRLLHKKIQHLATVPAVDLPLDDIIHISGAGQYILGKRIANAMNVLRNGKKAGLPPIMLKKVKTETFRGCCMVIAEFDNVCKSLQSAGRPSGFYLYTGGESNNIVNISLDGKCIRILSNLESALLNETSLYYGYGTDPYCNIYDGADRSLPVFGPIFLGKAHAITSFIRDFGVSSFRPSGGKLYDLKYPSDLKSLQIKPRCFLADFCSMHPEISERGNADEILFYACEISCPEKMDMMLVLGYDGPVKVWIDKKQIFHDPDGINPATPSKSTVKFSASEGQHIILIALATNNGAAWGIFARLERIDLEEKLVRKGRAHYAMATVNQYVP